MYLLLTTAYSHSLSKHHTAIAINSLIVLQFYTVHFLSTYLVWFPFSEVLSFLTVLYFEENSLLLFLLHRLPSVSFCCLFVYIDFGGYVVHYPALLDMPMRLGGCLELVCRHHPFSTRYVCSSQFPKFSIASF